MNVSFHALASVGISHLAARGEAPEEPASKRDLPIIIPAFVAGILSHGILDGLKHGYPIPVVADPPLALLFIALWCAFLRPRYRPLFAAVFLGAILPDLIDLGPGIVNRLLDWRLPTLHHQLFPWHWDDGSGALYPSRAPREFPGQASLDDGDNRAVSVTNHLIVIVLSLLAIASNRAPLRFRIAP
jgi:hypothetical protein